MGEKVCAGESAARNILWLPAEVLYDHRAALGKHLLSGLVELCCTAALIWSHRTVPHNAGSCLTPKHSGRVLAPGLTGSVLWHNAAALD